MNTSVVRNRAVTHGEVTLPTRGVVRQYNAMLA